MARIGGVDLPKDKKVKVALTKIYGIGPALSLKILKDTGVNPEQRVKDMSENDVVKVRDAIRDYTTEGDLRRKVSLDIKRLIEIGCYRGQRHRKGLPVRGQRTKTNSRTVRGNVRKTMASGKRKESKT